MKEYTADTIRNVAFIGHGGSGKTTLTEACLYSSGGTTRLGRVEEGNTISDYHADEIERQISINASLIHYDWRGTKINILDTPGYNDFTGDVKASLRVSDTAVVFLKAVEGVEVGTEIVWKSAKELNTGVVVVINKLDNDNSDFDKTLQSAINRFTHDIIPIQFPLQQGVNFESIVDILRMKVLKYERDGKGRYTEADIPAELQAKAQSMREQRRSLKQRKNFLINFSRMAHSRRRN